jgi:hypothetical protein
MLFFIITKTLRSFEERSKVSFTRLFSIDLIIFIFKEGIICPEEPLYLIRIEKFFLELIKCGAV